MGEDNEVLSHEEMWDDSELIDSWNQALDEYKVCVSDAPLVHPACLTLRRNTTAFLRRGGASKI